MSSIDFEKEIKQGQKDFLDRLREIDERETKIELEEERIRKKIIYDRIGCFFMLGNIGILYYWFSQYN